MAEGEKAKGYSLGVGYINATVSFDGIGKQIAQEMRKAQKPAEEGGKGWHDVCSRAEGPLVEDFLRPLARGNTGARGLLRAPEADVVETEREILVTVDVPGSNDVRAGDQPAVAVPRRSPRATRCHRDTRQRSRRGASHPGPRRGGRRPVASISSLSNPISGRSTTTCSTSTTCFV